MADHFWLSDAQWAVIEPHIPKVYTGKRRVDDRRVISGIVHRLRGGGVSLAGAAGGLRAVYDGVQPLQSLEQAGPVAADPDGSERRRRSAGRGHDRLDFGQGPPLGGRRKRGASLQAIGRSRGGRTTKVHLLVDEAGRPRVLQLSPGQASDIVAANDLILGTRASRSLLADRAYDGDALRRMLIERGTIPVIPNKINRVNRHPFDAVAYRLRKAVERAFCRLKDFRAIATRYDKTARNYLAGLCLVAAITLWAK